jgi:hypothetical protein
MANPADVNHFMLKGHHIEVEYTRNMEPNFTALTYKDQSLTRGFKPNEITTTQTVFGSLVTVPLVRSIDAGGTTFGFFLPEIPESPQEQIPHFTTIAIREEFGGPDRRRPTTWQSFAMEGTATKVAVPF